MKLIGYSPSAPGTYSIFDRETLTSTAHSFVDTLKIDYSSNFVVLDPDGATYNGERGGEIRVGAGPGEIAFGVQLGGGHLRHAIYMCLPIDFVCQLMRTSCIPYNRL